MIHSAKTNSSLALIHDSLVGKKNKKQKNKGRARSMNGNDSANIALDEGMFCRRDIISRGLDACDNL